MSLETVERDKVYRVRMTVDRTNGNRLLETVFSNGGELVSFREDVKQLSEAFMDLTQLGVRS